MLDSFLQLDAVPANYKQYLITNANQ